MHTYVHATHKHKHSYIDIHGYAYMNTHICIYVSLIPYFSFMFNVFTCFLLCLKLTWSFASFFASLIPLFSALLVSLFSALLASVIPYLVQYLLASFFAFLLFRIICYMIHLFLSNCLFLYLLDFLARSILAIAYLPLFFNIFVNIEKYWKF